MGKVTWNWIAAFFEKRGMKPEEAFEVLKKSFLDNKQNYSSYNGNIWKDPENRKYFIVLIEYVYDYMKAHNVRWNEALIKTYTQQQKNPERIQFYKKVLTLMLVPGSVVNGKLAWSPNTFAKHMKQWRQHFFDKGWLHYDTRPEIIRSRYKLEDKGIISKKENNKKVAKAIGKALNYKIIGNVIHKDPLFKKKKKKK